MKRIKPNKLTNRGAGVRLSDVKSVSFQRAQIQQHLRGGNAIVSGVATTIAQLDKEAV